MPRAYKRQTEFESLTGNLSDAEAENSSSNRISDLKVAVFGNKRPTTQSEIRYHRNDISAQEQAIPENVETRLSDLWVHKRATTGNPAAKRGWQAKMEYIVGRNVY